jgi:hypothetical protein
MCSTVGGEINNKGDNLNIFSQKEFAAAFKNSFLVDLSISVLYCVIIWPV